MGIFQEKRTIRASVADSHKQELPAMPPTPAPVSDPIREKYERQKEYDEYVDGLLAKKKKDEEIARDVETFCHSITKRR